MVNCAISSQKLSLKASSHLDKEREREIKKKKKMASTFFSILYLLISSSGMVVLGQSSDSTTTTPMLDYCQRKGRNKEG